VHDPNGDLNPENPMGVYYGSINLGTQLRAAILRVDDQFSRTVTNTWGAVGNPDGDTWTNGTSSGGTVAATDWTVSSGSARHSLPVADAYRVSELSKATRLLTDGEVRLRIKVPTNDVTGTGALATEVWFRTVDVNNFVAVSLAYQIDESLQVAFYDRTAGVNRYLLFYTTIPGLSLSTAVDYDLRCQIEGSTLRAKVWPITSPEPLDWTVTASGADVRAGYVSVASYCFAGNTNTKPLSFQYDQLQVRLPVFAGEVTSLKPQGTETSVAKLITVEAQDILARIQTTSTLEQSVMRRGRGTGRRWFFITSVHPATSTVRTFTIPTSSVGAILIGDFCFLSDSHGRKEDTPFRITGASPSGGNTVFTFTPDARDAPSTATAVSVYRDTATAINLPIAYWPMEDGDEATQISSGLPGGEAMSIAGSVTFGADSGFPCSAPILQINDAELLGRIPDYDNSNQAITITFLLGMPTSDEAATGTDLLQWYTTGTGWSYDLRYTANGGGSLQLLVFAAGATLLFDSGQIDFGLRGNRVQVTVVLQQVGGTVTYSLFTTNLNGGIGGVGPATITGVTSLGKLSLLRVNPAGGYDNVSFGHLAVVPGVWNSNITFIDVLGWIQENALQRCLRLCYEANLPVSYHASWDVRATDLGVQKKGKFFDLLTQTPESDGGFLYGPKGAVAVEYRTRGSLANQKAVITLTGGPGGHIGYPFDPVFDHADTRNYVTVERIDGTTAIAELASGRLSTAAPPAGIGQKPQGFQLSLGSDTQAQLHADWRLSTGTVARPRVTEVVAEPAARNSITVEQMAAINIGSRVDLAGLAAWNIYGTLPQLVTGYTMRLGDRFAPTLSVNCVPYDPYQAFAFTGDDSARPDAADTVTGTALTTPTQTGSLTLISQSGFYLWTTDPADFPLNIMIAGEVITLSAITGNTSPQTATITGRSVNGVSKTHAAGKSVTLAQRNRWQFR
jgi:hypothetical protein